MQSQASVIEGMPADSETGYLLWSYHSIKYYLYAADSETGYLLWGYHSIKYYLYGNELQREWIRLKIFVDWLDYV